MRTPELQAKVDEALANAIQNDYAGFAISGSLLHVAMDLKQHCSEVEDEDVSDLYDCVVDYRERSIASEGKIK